MSWKSLSAKATTAMSQLTTLTSSQATNTSSIVQYNEAFLHQLKTKYHHAIEDLAQIDLQLIESASLLMIPHAIEVLEEILVILKQALISILHAYDDQDDPHHASTPAMLTKEWNMLLFVTRKNLIGYYLPIFKRLLSQKGVVKVVHMSVQDLFQLSLDNYELMEALDCFELSTIQAVMDASYLVEDYWTCQQMLGLHRHRFSRLYHNYLQDLEQKLKRTSLLQDTHQDEDEIEDENMQVEEVDNSMVNYEVESMQDALEVYEIVLKKLSFSSTFDKFEEIQQSVQTYFIQKHRNDQKHKPDWQKTMKVASSLSAPMEKTKQQSVAEENLTGPIDSLENNEAVPSSSSVQPTTSTESGSKSIPKPPVIERRSSRQLERSENSQTAISSQPSSLVYQELEDVVETLMEQDASIGGDREKITRYIEDLEFIKSKFPLHAVDYEAKMITLKKYLLTFDQDESLSTDIDGDDTTAVEEEKVDVDDTADATTSSGNESNDSINTMVKFFEAQFQADINAMLGLLQPTSSIHAWYSFQLHFLEITAKIVHLFSNVTFLHRLEASHYLRVLVTIMSTAQVNEVVVSLAMACIAINRDCLTTISKQVIWMLLESCLQVKRIAKSLNINEEEKEEEEDGDDEDITKEEDEGEKSPQEEVMNRQLQQASHLLHRIITVTSTTTSTNLFIQELMDLKDNLSISSWDDKLQTGGKMETSLLLKDDGNIKMTDIYAYLRMIWIWFGYIYDYYSLPQSKNTSTIAYSYLEEDIQLLQTHIQHAQLLFQRFPQLQIDFPHMHVAIVHSSHSAQATSNNQTFTKCYPINRKNIPALSKQLQRLLVVSQESHTLDSSNFGEINGNPALQSFKDEDFQAIIHNLLQNDSSKKSKKKKLVYVWLQSHAKTLQINLQPPRVSFPSPPTAPSASQVTCTSMLSMPTSQELGELIQNIPAMKMLIAFAKQPSSSNISVSKYQHLFLALMQSVANVNMEQLQDHAQLYQLLLLLTIFSTPSMYPIDKSLWVEEDGDAQMLHKMKMWKSMVFLPLEVLFFRLHECIASTCASLFAVLGSVEEDSATIMSCLSSLRMYSIVVDTLNALISFLLHQLDHSLDDIPDLTDNAENPQWIRSFPSIKSFTVMVSQLYYMSTFYTQQCLSAYQSDAEMSPNEALPKERLELYYLLKGSFHMLVMTATSSLFLVQHESTCLLATARDTEISSKHRVVNSEMQLACLFTTWQTLSYLTDDSMYILGSKTPLFTCIDWRKSCMICESYLLIMMFIHDLFASPDSSLNTAEVLDLYGFVYSQLVMEPYFLLQYEEDEHLMTSLHALMMSQVHYVQHIGTFFDTIERVVLSIFLPQVHENEVSNSKSSLVQSTESQRYYRYAQPVDHMSTLIPRMKQNLMVNKQIRQCIAMISEGYYIRYGYPMMKLSFIQPSLAYHNRGIESDLEANAYESIVIQDLVLQYHTLNWTQVELEAVLWRLFRITKLWYESKQKTMAELRESYLWLLAIVKYFPQPCLHDVPHVGNPLLELILPTYLTQQQVLSVQQTSRQENRSEESNATKQVCFYNTKSSPVDCYEAQLALTTNVLTALLSPCATVPEVSSNSSTSIQAEIYRYIFIDILELNVSTPDIIDPLMNDGKIIAGSSDGKQPLEEELEEEEEETEGAEGDLEDEVTQPSLMDKYPYLIVLQRSDALHDLKHYYTMFYAFQYISQVGNSWKEGGGSGYNFAEEEVWSGLSISWSKLLERTTAIYQFVTDYLQEYAVYTYAQPLLASTFGQYYAKVNQRSSQPNEASRSFWVLLPPSNLLHFPRKSSGEILPELYSMIDFVEAFYEYLSHEYEDEMQAWYQQCYAEDTFLQHVSQPTRKGQAMSTTAPSSGSSSTSATTEAASSLLFWRFSDASQYIKVIIMLYYLKEMYMYSLIRLYAFGFAMRSISEQKATGSSTSEHNKMSFMKHQHTALTQSFGMFMYSMTHQYNSVVQVNQAEGRLFKSQLRNFVIQLFTREHTGTSDAFHFCEMFASKLMFASTGKNHCIAAANALQHCHQVMSKFIQTRTIHPKVISYDELVKMVSCNEAIPAERFASYPIMAAGGAGVNNALPLPPSSSMITTNFGSSNTAASGANVQKTFRLHLFYTFYSMRVKVAFQHLRKLLTQFLASSLEDFMNCFIPMSDVVDVLAILLFEHGGEMDEELRQQILTSNDRISASVLMHLLWKIVLQSMKGCKDCYVIDKFFFRSIYRQSDILYQCYQLVQEAKEASVQRSDQIYHEQALQQCFPLEVMKEIAELVLAVEDSNEVVAYFSNLLGSSENVCNTVNDSEAADGEISSSFDCQQGSANATESTKASPSTSYTNYFDVLQALFHPKYALQELRKLFDRQRVLIVSLWVNNTSSVLLWESLLLRKTKFEHLRNKYLSRFLQLAYIAQDFEVVFTTMNNITATGTTTPVPSTALTNYYLDKTMHVLHEMMQVKLETLDNAQDVNFREEDGYQWRMKMLENVFNAYLQYNKRKFTRILPKLEDMLRALMFSVTFYQRRKKEKMKLHRLQASVVERGNAELATQSQEDDLYFIAEDPSQTQSGSSGVEASTTEDETQDDQDDHLEAIAEMPIRDLLAWVNTKITAYNQKNAAINASQSGDISGIKKKRGRPASKVNTGSNVTDTTAETSIERDGMEEDVEEFNAQPFSKQVRFSSDCELPFDGQELFMETFEGIHEDEVLL